MVVYGKRRVSTGKARGRSYKKTRPSYGGGRPRIENQFASKRTLQRRAEEIRKYVKLPYVEILESATKSIKAKVGLNVENNSGLPVEPRIKHSKESALAFFIENGYSKAEYIALYQDSKSKNNITYPSYYLVK